ncbi:MAG TPA: hypothetical protein VMX97_04970 [Hyphomicrobiaceae bacterium]|nr:hypothetical protein [Hyphomicrobiaceae bacterium]
MAKAKTDVVIDARAVGNLSRAVKRKTLTREQHKLLGALISQLEETEDPSGLPKTVRYNLRVVDTQIRDVLVKSDGETFDDQTIAKMPEHMQRRILERLENIEARLTRAPVKAATAEYSTETFKCLQDFELCKSVAKGSHLWCTIAYLVCLARQLK